MPETPGSWEQRCAHLYQVIGCLADMAGVFTTSDDVADALDVAAGRGDVEGLLPWPKDIAMYQTVLKRNAEPQAPVSASSGAGAMKPVDEPAASAPVSATRSNDGEDCEPYMKEPYKSFYEQPNDKHGELDGLLLELEAIAGSFDTANAGQSARLEIEAAAVRAKIKALVSATGTKIERCPDGLKCHNATTGCCWGRCVRESLMGEHGLKRDGYVQPSP